MLNIGLIDSKKRELTAQLEVLESLEESIEGIIDNAAQEIKDMRDDIHCTALGDIMTELEQAGFEEYSLDEVVCSVETADEIDSRSMQ